MSNLKINITTIAVLAFSVSLTGCEDGSELILQEKSRPVRTTVVSEVPQGLERRFAGTTDSASTTALSFRIDGTIEQFSAKVGAELKVGEIIAKLDDSDLKLNLERSKAELAEARTGLTASKSRYNRLSDLHARKAISEMDFDIVKAEFEAAQAQLAQSERVVELNEQQVSYATLIAPTEGCFLSSAYTSVNENISSGQQIAMLNCGDTIEVTSIVPETVVNMINIGHEVDVLVKIGDGEIFPAIVTEIGLSSTTNGLYFVTAQLKDKSDLIRPGMAAEIFINEDLNLVKGNVWVPMVAINEEQGQRYVMIFDPTNNNLGVVRKVPIEVARFAQGYFEVKDGIEQGDRVITAGLNQIYDGLTVRLLPGESN